MGTAENKRLRHDLDALNAVFAGLDDRLRKQYELQIKSLREALDKAVAEKSVALKKVSYMADDLKKSETALVKETWNRENTKKKVPELESMIVERDGQIDFLTKNMGKGQEELKVMKTKLNSVARIRAWKWRPSIKYNTKSTCRQKRTRSSF